MARVGVYPGSFNPPTVAHLAIAEAARVQHALDRVVLSVSHTALAKEHVEHPPFSERVAVLHASVADHDWLEVRVTHHQLLVDVAAGFDLLVVGADKWRQIHDPAWYDDEAARDAAIAGLPPVAIVPRDDIEVPDHLVLNVPAAAGVSSTRARSGAIDLMTPAARAHAQRTGTWT
jgi:hypothetical protein